MVVEKKETKKKVWERWKAKSIIDPKKDISLKDKQNIVNELVKQLPQEKEKTNKKTTGRPEVITEATLQKLKLCFAVWMTDSQACYFCWIWERSLYYYQEKHPEFLQEKDVLKESITMQARVNIWRSIKAWNVADSWKWVERKDSSFTPKLQVNGSISSDMSEEDKEMYDKILQNNLLLWWKKEMKK